MSLNTDRPGTRRGRRPVPSLWFFLAPACLFLAQTPPLQGYVGPGAGFAFLSSFLVVFLTFFMALFSLLSWPFRLLLRSLKGRKAYRRSLVRRLVILGLDGLEPTLVEKFMAEGKLPNFSRLKKEGCYSPLQTTVPAISPVAWSSFMTGVEPSKHNIFDFLNRDPRTYLPGLSSARVEPPRSNLGLGKYRIPLTKPYVRGLRRSLPFWKILGENGIFSTVLRVPLTFPPEKFKGHLFSGMCAPDMKGSQGTFTLYTEDAARLRETEGGVVVLVKREGDVIRTSIPGPENTILKKPVEMTLPLEVKLDGSDRSAFIRAGGESFRLKERTFSPWVGLKFCPGLGLKVHAIARFYILSLQPKFEMYITPLNIDPARPALPISHPFIYSVYLAKLLGSFVTLGEANDTWALNEGALDDRAFLELAYLNHADWEAMFENALEKTPRGLVTMVFETTDSIQHMFFRYLDRDHPALRLGRSREEVAAIENLYRRMDGLLGRVLAKLDAGSALLVMSDHGFKPFRRGVNLNSWLREKGYLSLKPGCAASGEWFKDVDWEKTRAYALGLGGLYLNLKGREAHGTVEPGESARKLKAELAAGLEELKDPATGARAVTGVYDSERVYSGPYRDNAPDLIVGYNIGYRASWDGVKGKVNDVVFEDNTKAWSGDHCIDPALVPGVLFSSLKLAAEKPAIIDIAPTVLRLFGVEPPKHMDGRSLIGGTTDSDMGDRPEKKNR